MIRPPPTATLFPYTTLFRSLQRKALRCELLQGELAGPVAVAARALDRDELDRDFAERKTRKLRQFALHQDRKSTRLNSSHTVISYAVFCLKKKKKMTPGEPT